VALLYNIAADRELQEGDKVEIRVGAEHGREGTVTGFDLMSDRPVVVQYHEGRGTFKGKFAANEVEIKSYRKAPGDLEPLPTIRLLLSEMVRAGTMPSGGVATLRLGDGTAISFVAKQNQDIRRIYEAAAHQTVEERVVDVLRHSYVTRLPHLMTL
jgi:hypothetical protein